MKLVRTSLPLALAASALAHPAAVGQSPSPRPSSITPLGAVTRLDGRVLSPEEVTATVERLMRAGRVPGLALAILNRGEIVYQRGFGWRDTERRLPLADTTVMYAASFTKAMFAYMVMQLVQEGRLDLDRTIDRYLPRPRPEYEKYADLAGDERWRRITPRMLLSHTAGFPNWRFLNDNEKLDIKFEPGARYAYSGEGINLLQFVLEQGMGLNVDSLMRGRVFERFGMARTSMTWRADFEADHAIGYDTAGAPLGHRRRTGVRAAGSADSDLAGIARFLRGVLRGEGLSAAAQAEMVKPQIRIRSAHQFPTLLEETTDRDDAIALSYGLGWGVMRTPHGPAFFKEGHDDGWENYMIAFDGPQTGLIVMTNSSNGESIFRELLATLIGDTFTPWEWERYVPYDAAEAER
ncbi:MAG TPA: serine hydrolase domain-containing protein [Longimicrobium sp.]|nr:serine hydrolase domain-containing protein [Longimicrobium sp.]